MKKQSILPIIVLATISLAVALLLGAVNMITGPIIKEAEEQRVYDSFREVLDGKFEPVDPLPENAEDTVNNVYLVTDGDGAEIGHVVTVTVKGYAGDISMTVGVLKSGEITKVIITSQSETHGKGGMAEYPDKFAGLSGEDAAAVELFSGATASSTAIKNGVLDAVSCVTGSTLSGTESGGESGGTDPSEPQKPPVREDAELLSLAEALISGDETLTDVTPTYGGPKDLYKLYKTNKDRYVAYVVKPGEYVAVASEAIFLIDESGEIASLDILTWNVGHGVGAGDFAEHFVGADAWNVDSVELVSGATGTATDMRSSVSEALIYVKNNSIRNEKKLTERMKMLVEGKVEGFEKLPIPEKAPDVLRDLYKETSGLGFFAHIVVPGEYVAVATEAIVYYSPLGEILNIDLLVWNVGHGVESGDFELGFIGKTEKELSEVELVSGATGTSGDFRDALISVSPYIPFEFPVMRLIGIVILSVSIVGFVLYLILSKRKWRAAQ